MAKKVSEERLQYLWEAKRLESFKKWPFKDNTNISKAKMAEAGFFYVGTRQEPDAVQCFLCNKQLDGWCSSDNPWEEHTKHANKCQFVVLGKQEDELTYYELFDLAQAMLTNLVYKFCNEKEKELATKNDEIIELFEKLLND